MKILSNKLEVRKATLVWKCPGEKCKRIHSLTIQFTQSGTEYRHDTAIIEEGQKISCACGKKWKIWDLPLVDITSPFLIEEIKRGKKRT